MTEVHRLMKLVPVLSAAVFLCGCWETDTEVISRSDSVQLYGPSFRLIGPDDPQGGVARWNTGCAGYTGTNPGCIRFAKITNNNFLLQLDKLAGPGRYTLMIMDVTPTSMTAVDLDKVDSPPVLASREAILSHLVHELRTKRRKTPAPNDRIRIESNAYTPTVTPAFESDANLLAMVAGFKLLRCMFSREGCLGGRGSSSGSSSATSSGSSQGASGTGVHVYSCECECIEVSGAWGTTVGKRTITVTAVNDFDAKYDAQAEAKRWCDNEKRYSSVSCKEVR